MSKYVTTNFDRGLNLGKVIAEGHAQAEIDELRAENEKLRTQLMDVTESMGRVEERCAELRRLAHDMMCFYCYALSPEDRKQREAELLERAHKLGVNGEEYIGMEVD